MRYRMAVGLAALLAAGCGGEEDTSLRDALEGLPRDTATAAAPAPVQVDTLGPLPIDTLPLGADSTLPPGADSGSVPWTFPGPDGEGGTLRPGEPNDVRPSIPDPATRPLAPTPGEWTSGVLSVPRSGSPMTVQTGIRTARHPEYDRVVLELSGDELPGYHVEYVDRPVRQCGSGAAVPVQGDGWLLVRLEPSQAHDDEGRATVTRANRAFRPNLTNVLELRLICDFEGQVEWVIGVRSPNPFRVLELGSPARVVIDIQN